MDNLSPAAIYPMVVLLAVALGAFVIFWVAVLVRDYIVCRPMRKYRVRHLKLEAEIERSLLEGVTALGDAERRAGINEAELFYSLFAEKHPEFLNACDIARPADCVIIKWKKDPSSRLHAVCFYSDVAAEKPGEAAPVIPSLDNGIISADGCLRGNSMAVCVLEAAARLFEEGHVPLCDIYFAFGSPLPGGAGGAGDAADYFQREKIRFDTVFTGGGFPVTGVPMLNSPVCLVPIGEKGEIQMLVTAKSNASSGDITEAIARMNFMRMPMNKNTQITRMLTRIAPAVPFPRRLFFTNNWLFKRAALRALAREPYFNAMLRTTCEAEQVSIKQMAALFSVFTVLGDSQDNVAEYAKGLLSDLHVEVKVNSRHEATAFADTTHPVYAELESSIRACVGNFLFLPCICPTPTPSRAFDPLARLVIRFCPIPISYDDFFLLTFNVPQDERVSVMSLAIGYEFYRDIIKALPRTQEIETVKRRKVGLRTGNPPQKNR